MTLNKTDKINGSFQTPKDLLMFFATTFRNSALTTAVSFAALGYSRFYRGKSKLYSAGLVFISILILLISAWNNYLLYNTIQNYKNLDEYKDINTWEPISLMFFAVHIILLLFALWTLYRMMTNTQF